MNNKSYRKLIIATILAIFCLIALAACEVKVPGEVYVTFVGGEGAVLTEGSLEQTIERGATAEPPTFEREGYTFDGWDKDCDNISSDTIIKAKWIINQYTIVFHTDGGTVIAAITDDYNKKVDWPNDPEKEGHTFKGWYTDSDFTTAYERFERMPANNTDVYAKWSINKYKVTFDGNGGRWIAPDDGKDNRVQQIEYGTTPTDIPEFRLDGFELEWNNEIAPVEGDTIYIAQWQPIYAPETNYFTVIFKDWYGSYFDVQTIESGEGATAPAIDPIKEGYDFVKWEGDFTEVTSDLVITSKWAPKTFGVTFYGNGGYFLDQGEGVAILFAQSIEYGTSVDAPNPPTREGYTFAGWDKSFDNVKSNLTINAVWQINTYTVEFHPAGGALLSGQLIQIIEHGGRASEPELVREGYEFSGWLGYGQDYDFDNIEIIEDITFIAVWKEIPTYQVTFDLNGGAFYAGGAIEQTVELDALVAVPVVDKPGYNLVGWFLPDDDPDVDSPIDFTDYKITADTDFVAIWELKSYKVTFMNGDEKVKEQTVEYGKAADTPDDPEKDGYTFLAWDNNSYDCVTRDLTINAIWSTPHTYLVYFDGGRDSYWTGGSAPVQQITHDGFSAEPVFEKDGYKFAYWYLKNEDGEEVRIDNDDVTEYKIKEATIFFAHWVIELETDDVDIDVVADLTYNGLPQVPTSVTVKYEGELVDPDDYDIAYTNNINAGVNTAIVTITFKNNFAGGAVKNYTIGQATITVTPKASQTKVYGADDPAFTYDTTGAITGETPAFDGALARADSTNENVGNYAISMPTTFKLIDNTEGNFLASNYTLAFVDTVEFAITPATITVTPTTGQTKVYGAVDPTLGYGNIGAITGETPAFDGTLARADSTNENVGDYAIIQGDLKLVDNGTFLASNYNLVFATDVVYFAITPATITVTPEPDQFKVYGADDPVFKYDYSDGQNSEEAAFTGALTRVEGDDVGEYAILKPEDFVLIDKDTFLASNYTLVFIEDVIFEIIQKVLEDKDVDIEVLGGPFNYNGQKHTPEITVQFGTIGLVLGTDYTVTYEDNEEAGDATINISFIGNYDGTASTTFEILSAVTFKLEGADEESQAIVYGQPAQAPDWTKLGYTLAYLYADGTEFDIDTPITDNQLAITCYWIFTSTDPTIKSDLENFYDLKKSNLNKVWSDLGVDFNGAISEQLYFQAILIDDFPVAVECIYGNLKDCGEALSAFVQGLNLTDVEYNQVFGTNMIFVTGAYAFDYFYDENLDLVAKGSLNDGQYYVDKETENILVRFTSIGVDVFQAPDNITAIGFAAFKDNKDIVEIHLPAGCTVIGHRAFEGCTNLERVTRGGVDIAFSTDPINYSGPYPAEGLLFDEGNGDEGNGNGGGGNPFSIGAYAFAGCSHLTGVKLPAGTQIGQGAFDPDTDLTMDDEQGDPLPTIYIDGVLYQLDCVGGIVLVDVLSTVSALTIPDYFTSVMLSAFEGIDLANVNNPADRADGDYKYFDNWYSSEDWFTCPDNFDNLTQAQSAGSGQVYAHWVTEKITVYSTDTGATLVSKIASALAGALVLIEEGVYETNTVVTINRKDLIIRGIGTVIIKKEEGGSFSKSNRQVLTVTGRPSGEVYYFIDVRLENLILDANNRQDNTGQWTIALNILSADVFAKNVTTRNVGGGFGGVMINSYTPGQGYPSASLTAYGLKVEGCIYAVSFAGSPYNDDFTATLTYDEASCVFNHTADQPFSTYGKWIINGVVVPYVEAIAAINAAMDETEMQATLELYASTLGIKTGVGSDYAELNEGWHDRQDDVASYVIDKRTAIFGGAFTCLKHIEDAFNEGVAYEKGKLDFHKAVANKGFSATTVQAVRNTYYTMGANLGVLEDSDLIELLTMLGVYLDDLNSTLQQRVNDYIHSLVDLNNTEEFNPYSRDHVFGAMANEVEAIQAEQEAIAAVNDATDKPDMQAALELYAEILGIEVDDGSDYANLGKFQEDAANYVIDKKAVVGGAYTTIAEIVTAFNEGVAYETGKRAFILTVVDQNLTADAVAAVQGVYLTMINNLGINLSEPVGEDVILAALMDMLATYLDLDEALQDIINDNINNLVGTPGFNAYSRDDVFSAMALEVAFVAINKIYTEYFSDLPIPLYLDTEIISIEGTGKMVELFDKIATFAAEGIFATEVAGYTLTGNPATDMQGVKDAIVALMTADGRVYLSDLDEKIIDIPTTFAYGTATKEITFTLTFDISGLEWFLQYEAINNGEAYSVKAGNGFNSSVTDLTIRSTYRGKPVTTIGQAGFSYSGLQTLTIPSSVTTIITYAFAESYHLVTVNLNEGLISIGSKAFSECSALETINIPSSVANIDEMLFYNCKNLTTVTFSPSNNYIYMGTRAQIFDGCTSLQTEDYNDQGLKYVGDLLIGVTNKSFATIDLKPTTRGIASGLFDTYNSLEAFIIGGSTEGNTIKIVNGAVLSKDGKVLIAYPKNNSATSYTIPSSVEIIGDHAFYGAANLTEITFEEGSNLKHIGKEAFAICNNLTSIELPESLLTIGSGAFLSCSNLETIVIPSNVISIGNVTSIGNGAFQNCSALTNIELPASLTIIEANAFYNCSALTTVRIPNSVITIGMMAFWSSGVTTIYAEATSEPSGWDGWWNKINGSTYAAVVWGCEFAEEGYLVSFVKDSQTPEFAPERAGYTFEGWNTEPDFSGTNYANIAGIPDDITVYAKWAKEPFNYNENGFTIVNGVLTGYTILDGFDGIIDIPDGVTKINGHVFNFTTGYFGDSGSNYTVTINIPESVKTIEQSAFYNQTEVHILIYVPLEVYNDWNDGKGWPEGWADEGDNKWYIGDNIIIQANN